jgi:hypothetical protein
MIAFWVIYQDLSKVVGQRDKKVDIMSIDVVSTNELFSKYFCEALAKKFLILYRDEKQEISKTC